MRAKRRTTKTPDRRRVVRVAYDALTLAYRARQLRDLVEEMSGRPSPAAEAAQEALDWAVQAAEEMADLAGRLFGWKDRPPIFGDDERESMAERLDAAHLEVGLASRERTRKRGSR